MERFLMAWKHDKTCHRVPLEQAIIQNFIFLLLFLAFKIKPKKRFQSYEG
jgi:hypothetical protein